jgi:uncharacterized membrane protein YdcZ (DUF606 family)
MSQTLYIALALTLGVGGATQTAMIASIGRDRSAMEAAWVSILATVLGISAVLAFRTLRGSTATLSPPFDGPSLFAIAAVAAALALAMSVRGLPAYFAATGLLAVAYLVSIGYVVPKLGIALFLSAVTAGTLLGGLGLDHVGAFGGEIQQLTLRRVTAVLLVVVGVVVARSAA